MGNRRSTLRRGKTKEEECFKNDLKKDEVFTKVGSGEKSPSVQKSPFLQEEGRASKERTVEETVTKQDDEKLGFTEKSSALPHVVEVYTPSPCLSETHNPAPAIREKNYSEADWVDNNRAKLIQSDIPVIVVADEMLQQKIIHREAYANIKAARTNQEQMRELYTVLTTRKAKCAFYGILQNIQPGIFETEDVVKEVMKKHKEYLREKSSYEFEGTEKDRKDAQSLDKIYTELHIIQGESERVNIEHEIWEIVDKSRSQTAEGTKINCNDIFKSTPENCMSSEQDRREVRAIRTVMTKGIAGIGKTVSVKKFILDWADGTANEDLDFIFVMPFRELNLIKDKFSLETLVRDFHPELKNIKIPTVFANHKVLFIFDGLDESQLKLNFKTTKRLTDATKESSVDTLVTNLIREHLLPSALIWITSRPGAVQRIPREYVQQWTEVRGFNDSQKIQYFKKRVEDKAVAERIITNITMSRSLYIMCHIPIFCWIAAKVLACLLGKMNNTQDANIKIPTTLTEMYTYFLCIQMQVATDKYDMQNKSDAAVEEIFRSNVEFILKLGRMAFEHLKGGNIVFTTSDLKKYGIDINKAGVHCGLCTQIFKEENVFNTRKLYCFVHLTVQEYFAALFVYHSFASKKIDSPSLKNFLLMDSVGGLNSFLDADPVDLPLDELMDSVGGLNSFLDADPIHLSLVELMEIAIANSTLRKTGELDMFLRFLIGMSLQSTQELLHGLIQQTEEHSAVVEEIRSSLIEIDLGDCSPERCLNLVHCLIELKDSSLHETVQQYVKPNNVPETQLSPVQCSALADSILMSNTPLDEFDLKRYRPSTKGAFRLLPAVRNSRKARISGVTLNVWLCETISSALRMPNSVLTELHLTNSTFYEIGTQILIDGLLNAQCQLEALSLSGSGCPNELCKDLESAIKSVASNVRELELSGNIMKGLLCSLLSVVLFSPKLEKLRLNRNGRTEEVCRELVTALSSNSCHLQELDMSYTCLKDSDMEILCSGLMSTNCKLKILSVSHNKLSEKGCETVASALGSRTSCLTELDLSYNDVQDSGVKTLCNALINPQCCLKTLRLSFCKVTVDGCVVLASALRSEHCRLRELDLSFNHLADQGAKLLTEIQKDSRCSLEELNVDHSEECWFDLKLLRQYACDLTLDPNTAGSEIILSEENKMATCIRDNSARSHRSYLDRFDGFQVLCEEGLTGRHYWEAECDLTDVGVVYKSIDRASDCSSPFSLGRNEKSWCWFNDGSFHHNDSCLTFPDNHIRCNTIGVYLDWPAGILSFFRVLPEPMTHMYTVCTKFTEPLQPGFSLSYRASLHLCKLK